MDWGGLHAGECCWRAHMGEDIRHLGPQTDLTYCSRTVLCFFDHMRESCEHEDANHRTFIARSRRRWNDSDGNDNDLGSLQHQVCPTFLRESSDSVFVLYSKLTVIRHRSLHFGLLEVVWAIAGGVGPVLGGVLTQ